MRRKIHREDIINAGLEIMFLHGYNSTGIKEITDAVDIPKGSFYNHFKNKEEFGVEVLQHYCSNAIFFYKEYLVESNLSPLARIKAFYEYMINYFKVEKKCTEGCLMGNFSQELADVNERFRALLDDAFADCEQIISSCIKDAQKLGEINTSLEAEKLGHFILNSWHGALIRMKSSASIAPLEEFKTTVFTLLLV